MECISAMAFASVKVLVMLALVSMLYFPFLSAIACTAKGKNISHDKGWVPCEIKLNKDCKATEDKGFILTIASPSREAGCTNSSIRR